MSESTVLIPTPLAAGPAEILRLALGRLLVVGVRGESELARGGCKAIETLRSRTKERLLFSRIDSFCSLLPCPLLAKPNSSKGEKSVAVFDLGLVWLDAATAALELDGVGRVDRSRICRSLHSRAR